jgi:cytochrome c oxidase subunit 2
VKGAGRPPTRQMNLPARFDFTFRIEVIVACVVFGLVCLTVVFALVRSATERGKHASEKTGHKKTEVFYVSLVAAVAVCLMVLSIGENDRGKSRPDMTIKVTGFQWCWRFDYPGRGVSVTADCVDGNLPTLVVPEKVPILFDVTSADVIHSMWIPHLRFKLFAYPNYVNSFISTMPSTGTWQGECAEFCGEYHYAMHFVLKVVTGAQFSKWVASHAAGVA